MKITTNTRILLVIIALQFFGLAFADDQLLEWEDKSGSHVVEAQFVRIAEDRVVLRKKDGDEISVPFAELSDRSATQARSLADPTPEPKNADEEEDEGNISLTINTIKEATQRLEKIDTSWKTPLWPYLRGFYDSFGGYEVFNQAIAMVGDGWKRDFYWPVASGILSVAGFIISIWFIVVLFREGFFWGCLYFVPIVNLIVLIAFLFSHWEKAKRPFLWGLMVGILGFASVLLAPSTAFRVAMLEEIIENPETDAVMILEIGDTEAK
jgi:hypothetical protein